MAVVAITSGTGSGTTGALASDQVSYVASGKVLFSTDGGVTYIPFDAGDKVVFSSGLTVDYLNGHSHSSEFRHMAL